MPQEPPSYLTWVGEHGDSGEMARGILQLFENIKPETLSGAYRNGAERQTLHVHARNKKRW
jgi:hypothetical protein